MSTTKSLFSIALVFACLLLVVNFGLRSSMGFFVDPISTNFGYGREVFAFSLALQNLCWGIFQPFAGAFADRYGCYKAIIIGTIVYALGLYITSVADSAWGLHVGSGVLIGMGISATGFGVVLPALARMVPPEKRGIALGMGTSAGSAGQLLVVPVAQEFLAAYGYETALLLLAIGALSMIVFGKPLSGAEDAAGSSNSAANDGTIVNEHDDLSLKEALTEARGHIHYWLLIAGFFVCGFQLAFITVHMPPFLSDLGFDPKVAVISLSMIGLFNIVGSLLFGHWSGIYSKKNLLGLIYLLRAISIAGFMLFPITEMSVYIFSAVSGFLWLGTVPPTSGIVAQMFGLKHMGTLYGIVFLNHQIGSFMGVWLGGYLFDQTGAYWTVWWAACGIALLTAFIHIFIDDRPVERLRTSIA